MGEKPLASPLAALCVCGPADSNTAPLIVILDFLTRRDLVNLRKAVCSSPGIPQNSSLLRGLSEAYVQIYVDFHSQ